MAFVHPTPLLTSLSSSGTVTPIPLSGHARHHPHNIVTNVPSRRVAFVVTATAAEKQQQQPSASATDSTGTEEQQEPSADTTEKVSFPMLYDAWFGPTYELSGQMQAAVGRAYAAGVRDMELQWPVVPNLEEIAAGTLLNMNFGKQVADELGMSNDGNYQYIKRYLASFCNVWWALQIAKALIFASSPADGTESPRTVWCVSSDGISKAVAEESLAKYNVRLASLRNPPPKNEMKQGDVVVICDPQFDEQWKKGASFKPPGDESVLIFLNSQFNESYGLTGPRWGRLKQTECVYFLKRITRGYVFYSYPGPWTACLEKPDSSIEVLREFERQPSLRDVSGVVRLESNRRYGGLHNDRYAQGFGGRL